MLEARGDIKGVEVAVAAEEFAHRFQVPPLAGRGLGFLADAGEDVTHVLGGLPGGLQIGEAHLPAGVQDGAIQSASGSIPCTEGRSLLGASCTPPALTASATRSPAKSRS